jgi:uncharacterized protein involved in response to NO
MTAETPGAGNRHRARILVIFSLGLRPFFGAAALLALIAIALWILWIRGVAIIAPPYGMPLWHMHEMVFAYGSAVLSGFLLTALPNWTGRPPVSGAPLMALFALWLAGRIVMAVAIDPVIAGWIDAAYLPVLAAMAAREIIAGKNWRNLMVLGPIVGLALANILFHYEVNVAAVPEYSVRFGLAALAVLLTLIGGRIVPAFSRNWLSQQPGDAPLPAPFGRYDGLSLVVLVLALSVWVVVPYGWGPALLLAAAAALHTGRLMRWAGMATLGNPLLAVLHLAYAMIPASLFLLALAAGLVDRQSEIAGIHLLGIGAIGGMTLAVMTRASIGHTGRALLADGWIKGAFLALFAATAVRAAAAYLPLAGWLIDLSALLWIAAFLLFLLRIGPWLLAPRLRGK